MAKSAFRRGLRQEFVEHLNEMYSADGWWRKLVEDKKLFLAIRENYINIYFRGCSVLELRWSQKKKEITGKIHYKYLLKPSIRGSKYIKVNDSGISLPQNLRSLFLDGLDNVNELKQTVKRYAEAEKTGVHNVVMSGNNPNVVDTEIAISDGRSAPRLDMAAVHEHRDRLGAVKLVFYEAKHFKNDELRSNTDIVPVVEQMTRYTTLININRNALLECYRRVCCNLFELEGVGAQNIQRHKILGDIITGAKQLEIDDQPRLIAFGFDKDQRDGTNWKPHADKLTNALGRNRVLFAGKAGDIRLERR